MLSQIESVAYFVKCRGQRLDSGVTQTELHCRRVISKSAISEVLAGKKPFSRQMIRKLAAYFGVDVTVLAGNL
jgi:HTH-type transcriptional regulator/antitoxin HigA